MKSRHLRLLALLSLSLAALAACSDAIYSTIETEKKTATNTLSQTLSVFGIAVSPAQTYYVAAGAIFQGVLSGSTVSWTPNASDNSRPWNPSGLLCNAMALFGSNLFGGFIAQDGTPSLYKSSASPYSFAAGATVVATASSGEQVTMLSAANANLFVGGATLSGTNYVFELEYSATGVAPWTVLLPGQPYPFVGVAWDGTNYWTASGSTLFQSPAVPTSFASNASQSWGTINGVFATASGAVFVATKTNGVYYSTNSGGTWAHINPDVVGTATVSYLTVAGPVDSGNDKYLVGSDGYGYYTLSISAGTMSRFGDSTIALYSASVSRIALDGSNVLMGTNGKGLWRAVFDPTTGALASGQSWINE